MKTLILALVLLSACGKVPSASEVKVANAADERIVLTINPDNTANLDYQQGNPSYLGTQNGTWSTPSSGAVIEFQFGSTTGACCTGASSECAAAFDCNFSSFGSRQFE